MADRTSAGLFRKFFELLAKNPTEEHKEIAEEIWTMRKEYDFNEYQMEADEYLIKLGLAKMGIDPGCQAGIYSDSQEIVLYKGEDY